MFKEHLKGLKVNVFIRPFSPSFEVKVEVIYMIYAFISNELGSCYTLNSHWWVKKCL